MELWPVGVFAEGYTNTAEGSRWGDPFIIVGKDYTAGSLPIQPSPGLWVREGDIIQFETTDTVTTYYLTWDEFAHIVHHPPLTSNGDGYPEFPQTRVFPEILTMALIGAIVRQGEPPVPLTSAGNPDYLVGSGTKTFVAPATGFVGIRTNAFHHGNIVDGGGGDNQMWTSAAVIYRVPPPPVIECPGDLEFACSEESIVSVTVHDPGEQELEVTFSVDGDAVPSATQTIPAGGGAGTASLTYTFGGSISDEHEVAVTASTPDGRSSSCTIHVTVSDAQPPSIEAAVVRPLLWPPRGGMLPAGLSASAADGCGDPVPLEVTVFSSESPGDPPLAPDMLSSESTGLTLRGERDYPGQGRVYLIRITATSLSGKRTTTCRSVIVPLMPVGTWILQARARAAAAETPCLTDPDAAALPGYTNLGGFMLP